MDNQRLILLLVFSFSLVMLWDAWLKQGMPKQVAPATAVQGTTPASASAVPVPTAAAPALLGSTPIGAAPVVAIVVVYALLALPAARIAIGIPSDDAIERMVVVSDPDVVATQEFRKVFPEKEAVLLLAELLQSKWR